VQHLLGNKKIRKLRRNRGEPAFLVPCLGVQHVVETPFPAIPLGFFSREIGQPFLTSTVEGSIRINTEWGGYSGKWNADMLDDYCWTFVRETPTEEYKRYKTTIRVPDVTFIFLLLLRNQGPEHMLRMHCSLKVYCARPVLTVPTFAARCLHVLHDARDPSSERWNFCGRETDR